jgi:hypothetical protein
MISIINSGSRFWSDETHELSERETAVQSLIKHGLAIKNFVNIATGENIPVKYSINSMSCTDGKSILIDGKLHDGNLDVTVGIALHEASHIKYTDFTTLRKIAHHTVTGISADQLKTILNVLEDRRIDSLMKMNNPGYRVYYTALENQFFNNDYITRKLKSTRDESIDSYLFHLINMINPAYDPTALKLLPKIDQMIDLPNITRFTDTNQVYQLSIAIAKILATEIVPETKAGKEKSNAGKSPKQSSPDNDSSEDSSDDNTDSSDSSSDSSDSSNGSSNSSEDSKPQTEAEGGASERLKDLIEEEKAIKRLKDFIDGKVERSTEPRDCDHYTDANTLMDYDITQNEFMSELSSAIIDPTSDAGRNDIYVSRLNKKHNSDEFVLKATLSSSIRDGIHLGNQLVNRMKLRQDTIVDVSNRQLTGKFDRRMAAALGTGIESVFKRVSITSFDPVSIFISIDFSGSMNGTKIDQSKCLAAAIMQCFSKFKSYRVHVTARYSLQLPTSVLIYDSKTQNIATGLSVLNSLDPSGGTPEGLCFPSIMSPMMRDLSKNEVYFINISDGEPSGKTAVTSTTNYIDKMKRSGVTVMSYLISRGLSHSTLNLFRKMYGENSAVIMNDLNAITISNQLNSMLMKKVHAAR